VGGFLATSFGPRAPFAAYAALALIALIPTFTLAPGVPVQRAAVGSAPVRRLSIAEIVIPRLAYFGVVWFAALTRGPIISDLLHLYAAFTYNLDATQIGFLATAATSLSLPIGFLAGWIMDRYGRKATMVPGFLSVMVTMLMLAATAYLHLDFAWYVVCFLAGIASQSLTGGSIQTVGADVAPPEARGMFLGLWRFTGQLGVTVSPALFAFLAETTGYGNAFVYVAASGLCTALLLILLVPETSAKRRATAAATPAS
jgi:MFS family permease